MIALLNWRIWAAGAMALAMIGGAWKAYTMGEAHVQAKWDAQSLSIAKQSLKLSEEATRTTTNLEARADKITETKNVQINSINTRLATALDELRKRPGRPGPGDLSKDPGAQPAVGCTGAQLWREDASAFSREAARADRLLATLGECQAKYNAAYQAVNK